MAESRTLHVGYMTRVEGEGALTIRLEGGEATQVELNIFEPPRFFEAFLRGRSYREAPDITARICGICPVAYQTSSCNAMEDAYAIRLPDAVRALRRLLYCGEWIESHALHVFFLHAPDFLGFPDGLSLAKVHPEPVKKALRMKKIGNTVMARLGGREIHPVNVRVGGFYRCPRREELADLLPELRWGLGAAEELCAWLATLPMPGLERDVEYVSLRHPDEYPICGGRVVSSRGLDIDVHDYEDHFEERHVPWSHALHSQLRARGSYLVGPLARYNLCFDQLPPRAQAAARAAGLPVPCHNPFQSILVRMVELIFAFDEAIRIIEGYTPPPAAAPDGALPNPWGSSAAPPASPIGRGASEAPRGLLFHRYTLDAEGTILDAKIVPPTSQNQATIEEDLRALAPELAAMPLDEATRRAEQAVRNYDPCISCATHFLRLNLEQVG